MFANTSRSFSSTNILNDAVSTVVYEISNKCASTTGINQSMNFRGAIVRGCSVRQTASSNVNFSCLQSSSFGTELKNKLGTVFTEKLRAETASLGIGAFNTSESTSLTNLVNSIVNNVDIKGMSSCINDAMINQSIDNTGAIFECRPGDSIEQTATLSVVSKCMQANTAVTNALSQIDNIVQKKIEASSGIDFMKLIIIFIIILATGLGVYLVVTTSGLFNSSDL